MKTLGLIAGAGQFPVEVAQGAHAQGLRVVALGIRGSASRDLAAHVDRFYWVGVARIGQMIRYLKREGATGVVLAGKVRHTTALDPRRILHLWPDRRFIRFYRRLRGDRRADAILGAFANELAQEGIHMESSIEHVPHLTIPPGLLTRRPPTDEQRADIRLGWHLAKAMGGLDVGQTVVVKEGIVLAVEAVEGTDECIRRGGLLGRREVVVVKVAKPKQDLRFDLPTIGPDTIAVMAAAGARVLAIEAGKTLVLKRDELVRAADEAKIVVVALSTEEMDERNPTGEHRTSNIED